MTVKKIQPSSVLGDNFYIYELSSSNYTPALNATITITCKCKDVYANNISSKSLTLYQNGTSKGAKTTNSNGVATWDITCSTKGIQKFNIGDTSIEVFVDTKAEDSHTHGNLSNDGKVSNTSSDVMQYFCGVGASANVLYKSDKLSSAKIIDTTAHTNIGSSANANQSTINSSIDTAIGNKAASTHTHGNITADGKLNTSHNGTYTTFIGVQDSSGVLYKASKLSTNAVIDTTAHSNIGSSANDTQSTINSKIDAALANAQSQQGVGVEYINGTHSDTSTYTFTGDSYIFEDASEITNGSMIVYRTPVTSTDSTNDLRLRITCKGKNGTGTGLHESYVMFNNARTTANKYPINTKLLLVFQNGWNIIGQANSNNTAVDIATSTTGFSSTLTDTKVPSEKLIKEYVDGLIEDIQDYIYE